MTSTTRRPPTAPLTPVETAALSAVLVGADTPIPIALPTLPPGYTVTVEGTVALLTLPNGAACAFDGRIWKRGEKGRGTFQATDGAVASARARLAAHTAARAHAMPRSSLQMAVLMMTEAEATIQ